MIQVADEKNGVFENPARSTDKPVFKTGEKNTIRFNIQNLQTTLFEGFFNSSVGSNESIIF